MAVSAGAVVVADGGRATATLAVLTCTGVRGGVAAGGATVGGEGVSHIHSASPCATSTSSVSTANGQRGLPESGLPVFPSMNFPPA